MPYAPPSGWVEPSYQDANGVHIRFHASADCPRVREPADLRAVDRPYSAVRCTGCAND